MTMDPTLLAEARDWLDQLYEDLREQLRFEKSGEELLHRMETETRKYKGEHFDAVKAALGYWLRGPDNNKSLDALILIRRLKATEYIPDLEHIRKNLRSFVSPWPSDRLPLVEVVLKDLREADRGQKADKG